MIDGYKVYAGTWMTNMVINGYYPVSKACLQSWSNTEFIDKVIVADGHSTDDTIEKHKDISKIEIFKARPWHTADLSMNRVCEQITDLLSHISNKNEKCMLVLYCGDVIYTDPFRKELKKAIEALSKKENKNFTRLPFAKVLCLKRREKFRNMDNTFYTYSIIKFDKKNKWNRIKNETKLIGTNDTSSLPFRWNQPALSYETWFATREILQKKAKRHYGWKDHWTIDHIIDNLYIPKLHRYGEVILKENEHPLEAQEFFPELKEEHMGHSLFGRYT